VGVGAECWACVMHVVYHVPCRLVVVVYCCAVLLLVLLCRLSAVAVFFVDVVACVSACVGSMFYLAHIAVFNMFMYLFRDDLGSYVQPGSPSCQQANSEPKQPQQPTGPQAHVNKQYEYCMSIQAATCKHQMIRRQNPVKKDKRKQEG
jgi:hypothetical protein